MGRGLLSMESPFGNFKTILAMDSVAADKQSYPYLENECIIDHSSLKPSERIPVTFSSQSSSWNRHKMVYMLQHFESTTLVRSQISCLYISGFELHYMQKILTLFRRNLLC